MRTVALETVTRALDSPLLLRPLLLEGVADQTSLLKRRMMTDVGPLFRCLCNDVVVVDDIIMCSTNLIE